MKSMRYRKWIAQICIFVLCVLGMYSEITRVDSYSASAVETSSVITTKPDSLGDYEICTDEMLGIYRLDCSEAQLRLSARKLQSQAKNGMGIFLVSMEYLTNNHLLTLLAADEILLGQTYVNSIIISYIHHQDGLKG